MKIIFVDEHWQVENINFNSKDIIFSMRPDCSYLLKKKNVKFLDYSDFYNHKLEYVNYDNYTETIEKIVKIIDLNFFNYSTNYKNLNWKIFNDFSYILKIWYDTLFFHSKILSKIVSDFQPNEFEFSKKTDLNINREYLIDESVNIIELLSKYNLEIKLSYPNEKKQVEKKRNFFLFFQQNYLKNMHNYFFLGKKFINKLKIKYIFKYKKIEHLGIGCNEILPDTSFKSNFIHNIFPENDVKKNKIDEDLLLTTKKLLNNSESFQHGKISFYFIFEEIIKFIYSRSDFFYSEYKVFNKYLENKNIKSFIFQSMAPFYYPIFIFRLLAQIKNIPFFTWVHGGQFVLSNPGYDVVDYKFCKNHIGYGKYLIDLVNRKSSLKKINNKNYNINYVGSFKFDEIHKVPKYKSSKKKKIITFFIGCYTNMNHFYYGNNRKDTVTSLWRQQLEILKTLNHFSDQYNIVVKDYPNGFEKLWKNIVKKEFNNKFTYISNEKRMEQVFSESDLNIFPWVSTTFFESLYYESDIFLYDEDLFTEPFKKNLNNEIIWSTNLNEFKDKIFNYLKIGTFKKLNKTKSRNYFINYEEKYDTKINNLKKVLDKVN